MATAIMKPRSDFNNLLVNAASALDIPDHVYEDATLKYEDVGDWLGAEDSDLFRYKPEIYVQGSFRLGTVVRPITSEDYYDIDLVCHLIMDKEGTTQKILKEMVGERLRERDDLERILEPSRRCWTLEYTSETQMPRFHMDILPAIPNSERPPTGILLTDTELTFWQKSNPKAYADWFRKRMEVIFQNKRAAFAESIKANVEEVPEWQVKTPLQIAVQILKRHRDIHFQGRQDIRPASIIITTLAAQAYENQEDVYDALSSITRTIETNWGKTGFVEYRNGKWWVANPVDPGENFADKWNEYPERREAFIAWMKKVQSDFSMAASKRTLNESLNTLTPVLGRSTMDKVAHDMGISVSPMLPVPAKMQIQVPALGDWRHCQPPQWPERLSYKVNLSGSVYLKEYARKKLWDLTERSVPKNVWLRFSVTTNVPMPYDVRWQVVNTGQEAVEARQLRGGFYESDKGIRGVRWESTSYKGTHWIEAFIVKDGSCVARSGRKYVKIR
ncbi:MAG: nucleotide-binding domain-containing protein [Syntrophales bacterium]